MAAVDALNANPTILNVSDLPTRRPQPSTQVRLSPLSSILRTAGTPFLDPWNTSTDTTSEEERTRESSKEDEDDDMIEEIDEQEIFGNIYLSHEFFPGDTSFGSSFIATWD